MATVVTLDWRFIAGPSCKPSLHRRSVPHGIGYTLRAALEHLAGFHHQLAIEAEPVPSRAIAAELPYLAQLYFLQESLCLVSAQAETASLLLQGEAHG
jgi:hypothetical protein